MSADALVSPALLLPTDEPAEPQALSRLAPGRRAVIASVDDDGAVGRRLLDLGFRPGTPLRVVRRAPLGDPTTYELRGSRFCLRRAEAARIAVTVQPEA